MFCLHSVSCSFRWQYHHLFHPCSADIRLDYFSRKINSELLYFCPVDLLYRYTDSGRHYGKRSWQVPEHDGLLGSGSFPRPAGFTAGISAPKVRPNDTYQLNRTNEPYHPPRPYKVSLLLICGSNVFL